jgi:uncharacterized surface protein with fasciclin (FAS1) repeats
LPRERRGEKVAATSIADHGNRLLIKLEPSGSGVKGCPMPNIVEVAVSAGSFKTLVAAVTAAGLGETLSGPGPFTVFAPTDEAFAKLPAGTVEGLLKDIPALTKILTYHVVSGKVMASDAAKLTSAKTVEGSELKIDASHGVKINDATVVQADVAASNGVIHAIDTVLIPA